MNQVYKQLLILICLLRLTQGFGAEASKPRKEAITDFRIAVRNTEIFPFYFDDKPYADSILRSTARMLISKDGVAEVSSWQPVPIKMANAELPYNIVSVANDSFDVYTVIEAAVGQKWNSTVDVPTYNLMVKVLQQDRKGKKIFRNTVNVSFHLVQGDNFYSEWKADKNDFRRLFLQAIKQALKLLPYDEKKIEALEVQRETKYDPYLAQTTGYRLREKFNSSFNTLSGSEFSLNDIDHPDIFNLSLTVKSTNSDRDISPALYVDNTRMRNTFSREYDLSGSGNFQGLTIRDVITDRLDLAGYFYHDHSIEVFKGNTRVGHFTRYQNEYGQWIMNGEYMTLAFSFMTSASTNAIEITGPDSIQLLARTGPLSPNSRYLDTATCYFYIPGGMPEDSPQTMSLLLILNQISGRFDEDVSYRH